MPKVPQYKYQGMRSRFSKQRDSSSYKTWKLKRLSAQGGRCFYCHEYIEAKGSNSEHIVPLYRGGSNKRSNIVISCWGCNKEKGIKVISQADVLAMRQSLNKLVRSDKQDIEAENESIADFLRSI